MKFGLMYEIGMANPDQPGIEQQRYQETLAQVELADEVGFDYFWSVEHHFLKGFSHCSAPEVLYGAVSQRTKRIRIGHAVALLPGQYNHPVRVAERVAVLDILSNGRADLSTGRSTTLIEMEGFQVDPEETRAQWLEAINMIPRMWTEDPFSHEGHYYKIPPRSVVPKPVQKPHPPLWIAGGQPASFKPAGEMGLGMMCFSIPGFDELGARIKSYREGLENAKPVGKFINDQFAATVLVHCAESDQEAREVAGPEAMWFLSMAAALYDPWKGREVPDSYKHHVEAINSERVDRTLDDQIRAGAFAFGNPDTVSRILEDHEKLGVDQIMCIMQIGELSHQRIMNSIKLFGRYVIPHFQQKAAEAR